MKIKKEVMLGILKSLQPGLTEKAIIEQSDHFLFTKKEIVTYNDRICVIYPFESDFEFAIPANEFFQLIDNIDTEEIIFKKKKKGILIKAKGVKAKVQTKTDFKEMQHLIDRLGYTDIKKWKKLPEGFLEGSRLCLFSASKSNVNLSCLKYMDNFIYSTDEVRISKYCMKGEIKELYLPLNSIMDLIKYNPIKYCIKDSWIYFKMEDGIIFCCRKIQNEVFPDCEPPFKFKRKIKNIKLPKKLSGALKLSSVMAAGDVDDDKLIKVNIEGKRIKLKAEKDLGWIEQDVKIKKDIGEIEFEINPYFLMEMLLKAPVIDMGADRLCFKMDNFTHLISTNL